ncbi:alpha/beta hydrolase [Brevibacillus humidisoli]|uniref:esterase/lipase family protein n=1 Tax=Brevibacillus humidisoli TaxID=2895522 RepID=UPI001E3B35CB|nr:alpha/beta hydrolase [Brevibacillus humidisoli]UFJ42553.1 alpha/beta hydrolase [Brevibacillus humidisoli]
MKRLFFLSFLIFSLSVSLMSVPAKKGMASTATLEREQTFTSVKNGWSKVERWHDSNPLFQAEDYPPDGRGDQEGQRLTFFGNVKQPHSSRFLLYYGPDYETNPIATPVLLVHGANDNADRAWANPNELGSYGCGATSCPDTGLMQYLADRGYKVFAVNFSHKQGDNYYTAEHIHNAISIVKNVTGADKVDVVGWSKGAFAARMYASSVKKSGGTAYAGDIRKLVLLGNPNKGFDYIFRHGWYHNFSIFTECGGTVNAPAPHTQMVCYGLWRNHPELSIYTTAKGNFFPGQKQMLAKWDDVYPLPMAEQDWYTTYYGGQGFYTKGDGIDTAIEQGSLVQTILDAGVPSSIHTYLLSGNQNDIPTIHNEHTGPSDGVVFIDSAASEAGIGNVADNVTVQLNHLELGWAQSAANQIEQWLRE